MNSHVQKMLKMIDTIIGCQSGADQAKWDYNYALYDMLVELEKNAEQEFESALISLIDERIKKQ